MTPWTETILDGLWRGGIVVLPLALLATVLCRHLRNRPGARHAMWLTVLMGLVVSPFLPTAFRSPPSAIESGRMVAPLDPESTIASDQPFSDPEVPNALVEPSPEKADVDTFLARAPISVTPQIDEHSQAVGDDNACLTDCEHRGPSMTERAISRTDFVDSPQSGSMSPIVNDTVASPLNQSPADTIVTPDPPFMSNWRARFARLRDAWVHWGGQLATARDALGKVSPIPASLWIFGTALYALTLWINGLRMSRLLKHGQDAPRHVRRLVNQVASDLGVKRIPQCIVVRHRVSPMIWCGFKQRLVLPADLWKELDADGRVAVITHELAHLRRRDHWVRWIDAVIGCIYWWHPVVWWVRSRISTEAENCCDAWVTWLNPSGRRAYAEALLTARQYISSNMQAVPAVGMGAGTRKSKTFARRLTMIMTRKDAPGMSAVGWAFALVVVMTGWMATPARSDATAPTDPHGAYAVVESGEGVITVGSTTTAVAPVTSGVVLATSPQLTEEGGLEHRLDRLERQMSRLMELMESKGTGSGSSGWVTPRRSVAPVPPRVQQLARKPKGTAYPISYKMPSGKLEALTALMARDDVPVLISRADDAIVVNGTANQHAVFARFLSVISDDEKQSLKLSGGKLDALSKLMIREDVPVRVAPGRDHIDVIGSPAERQAVADFIKLINGEPTSSSRTRFGQSQGQSRFPGTLGQSSQYQAAQELFQLTKRRTEAAQRQSIRTERNAIREQLIQLRKQAETLERERDSMERVAEELREQAERIREQSERSRERAEELRSIRSEERAAGPEIHQRLASAELIVTEYELKANQVMVEAEGHSASADGLELQIDVLNAQADALEEYLSSLEEYVES